MDLTFSKVLVDDNRSISVPYVTEAKVNEGKLNGSTPMPILF
jgi:hypothetical protein